MTPRHHYVDWRHKQASLCWLPCWTRCCRRRRLEAWSLTTANTTAATNNEPQTGPNTTAIRPSDTWPLPPSIGSDHTHIHPTLTHEHADINRCDKVPHRTCASVSPCPSSPTLSPMLRSDHGVLSTPSWVRVGLWLRLGLGTYASMWVTLLYARCVGFLLPSASDAVFRFTRHQLGPGLTLVWICRPYWNKLEFTMDPERVCVTVKTAGCYSSCMQLGSTSRCMLFFLVIARQRHNW